MLKEEHLLEYIFEKTDIKQKNVVSDIKVNSVNM